MRKLSGFFLSLGLCLALATGISSAQTPDPRFDVCGQVRDSEGHPIPGVVVSDNYSVTVTDEDAEELLAHLFPAAVQSIAVQDVATVSSTHLTLPTKREGATAGVAKSYKQKTQCN